MTTRVTAQQHTFSGDGMSATTYPSQLTASDSSRADDSGSGSAGMHVVPIPPRPGGCSHRSQIAYLHVSQRKDERGRGNRRTCQNVMFPSSGQILPHICHEVRQSHNSISVAEEASLQENRKCHRALVLSTGHPRNGRSLSKSHRTFITIHANSPTGQVCP